MEVLKSVRNVCESLTLDSFLARLERYVNMDTPSADADALNRQSSQLQQDFAQAGCQVRVHPRPGGNMLECSVGTGPRQILLLGHMDTVFPVGTVQQHPYCREGDILHGPGVLDMKSGDLMILEILRHFSGQMPPDWKLCALLNCDEEIGSGESREMILRLGGQSEYCLCMEPSKPGYCTVARKGLITFAITAQGVSAHSGVNYFLGHSAIQALCRIVNQLYTLRNDAIGISVNIGGISGGSGKGNIVADQARLIGEIRYYQPELAQQLLDALTSIAADTGDDAVHSQLQIQSHRPPMQQSEASRALYQRAKTCAEANGLRLEPRTHGGGSDGAFVAGLGVATIDGMGAEGEFSHTFEEYVKADTLMPRLQTCIDLIQTLMTESEKGKMR